MGTNRTHPNRSGLRERSSARTSTQRHLGAQFGTGDRGDVPGWILVTMMTAGLVVLIWGLAGPALARVFEQAIERVSGF